MNKDDVLTMAKERFEYALERSSHNREKMRDDVRFAAATPDDPWQWEKQDQVARKGRPMLTINKMPQHIRQVTNDIRMNRPSIRFRPVDDDADPEVADILMGIVKHIEASSDADVAYDIAAEHQVVHGLGYIRVLTDYIREDSFDQDIYIKAVPDVFRCYDDPDVKDPAGADRKFFFIEERMKEKEFTAQFPDADPIDWTFSKDEGWFTGEKEIRIVEYFEQVEKPATLLMWANGSTSFKGDPMPDGVFVGERPIKERKTSKSVVMWRKLNGQEILEEKEFPCRYIPVARVVGNQWEVDGKTYLFGLVRPAKDSQRMYNVAQSAIVERVLQAPKSPWVAPAEAVEGYQKEWQTANTANHSFLPYNHVDENGNPIPAPNRTSPATVETGLNQIAMGASDDIKAETGQYDASLGQKSNETSGRAIMARQREGDMATFHYVDNLARAVRHIGRIILDMIPRIYDTQRVARIIGEDDSASNVQIDPKNQQALVEYKDEQDEIKRLFNPNIGTYDVYTTTGPSFTTRRMEAVDAMTSMTQANPALWQVIGDLLVKNMDWPGAEEMADRLKLTLIPPVQAELNKEEGAPEVPPQVQQQIQQMQQAMQQMEQALQNAHAEVTDLEQELQTTKQSKDGETQAKALAVQTDAQLAQEKIVREVEAKRIQAELDAQLAIEKAQIEAQTKVKVAVINAETEKEIAMMKQEEADETPAMESAEAGPDTNMMLAEALAGITQSLQALHAPKSHQVHIVKQPDGSFIGMKTEA